MQSNKRVSNMKNINKQLDDKIKVPRNRRFKGSKRSKFNKNANQGNNKKDSGQKKFVTSFKNIKSIFKTEPGTQLMVIPQTKMSPEMFKETYSERLYSPTNLHYICPSILSNPTLLGDIINNPEKYIAAGSEWESFKDPDGYVKTQAAICIYKVFTLNELEFAEIFPDPKNFYHHIVREKTFDITCQETRKQYNETFSLALEECNLNKEVKAEVINKVDTFIYNDTLNLTKTPKKREHGWLYKLRLLAPLRLF